MLKGSEMEISAKLLELGIRAYLITVEDMVTLVTTLSRK